MEIIQKQSSLVSCFKELDVYQKAYAVSLNIHKQSLSFPKIEQYALADQLRRSSKSVCANIAEGYGRQSQSKTEFKRFLVMAIGSVQETILWLDYCKDLNYLTSHDYQMFNTEYTSILRMLHAFRNKL